MRCLGMQLVGEDVIKNTCAHFSEQCVFGLEMRIEGTPSDICLIQDILYCDTAVLFFL